MDQYAPFILDMRPETKAIIQLMEQTPVGGLVTYAQMTKATGKEIRNSNGWVQTAVRYMQRKHDKVFLNNSGVGYYHSVAKEIIGATGKSIRKQRKGLYRAGRRLSKADLSNLHDVDRLTAVAQKAVIEIGAKALDHRQFKKVKQQYNNTTVAEANKRTLDMFKTNHSKG